MKIHILYPFIDGPYGGGNQFLKALKHELANRSQYSDDLSGADVCLFNGSPFEDHRSIEKLHDAFIKHPDLVYIIRIDGPTSLARGVGKFYDLLIKRLSSLYFDGIVFQSEWSRRQNRRTTGISSPHETIVFNAADPGIFNPVGRKDYNRGRKMHLIATSWSNNQRKGFPIYEYLDKRLDWSKYSMVFVGNAPCNFDNILHLNPVPSAELAELLRKNDVYITASRNDACPNSLLEALACGLPAIALNDGGHPEIIGRGGILFDRQEELTEKIEYMRENYSQYLASLPHYKIENAAEKYVQFGQEIRSAIEFSPRSQSLRLKTIHNKYRKLIVTHRMYHMYKRTAARGRRLLIQSGVRKLMDGLNGIRA
jgi:glycosyltransferase involved in cell wall biosynthesis